jgi:hypothetical protein
MRGCSIFEPKIVIGKGEPWTMRRYQEQWISVWGEVLAGRCPPWLSDLAHETRYQTLLGKPKGWKFL